MMHGTVAAASFCVRVPRILLKIFLLPRNVLIAFMLFYRRFVSPLYGEVCRYAPSCSSYALRALQDWGVICGVGLIVWRLLRCNPFTPGGIDDVPTKRNNCWQTDARGFVRPR